MSLATKDLAVTVQITVSSVMYALETRTDIVNLVVICKHFTQPVERILWEVTNPAAYTKLLGMDFKSQKTFANLIVKQSFAFQLKGVQPSQLPIKLPRLEKLHITHASLDIPGQVVVSCLMTPCMARLEVHRGTTDNFLIVTIRHLEITVRPEIFKPLANLSHLKKLSIGHDLKADPYMRNVGEFLPISRLCPLTHLHLQLKQRVPRLWIDNLARHHPQIEFLSLGMYVEMNDLSAHFPALEKLYFLYPDVPSNRADMNTSIRSWAKKMLEMAPKLQRFEASVHTTPYMDVQVRYEHGEHDIFCICSSAWDKDFTSNVPGPLIRCLLARRASQNILSPDLRDHLTKRIQAN